MFGVLYLFYVSLTNPMSILQIPYELGPQLEAFTQNRPLELAFVKNSAWFEAFSSNTDLLMLFGLTLFTCRYEKKNTCGPVTNEASLRGEAFFGKKSESLSVDQVNRCNS